MLILKRTLSRITVIEINCKAVKRRGSLKSG